ncbi:hypothetical protein [Luteimonas sp. YGD11-2]|uniref:hypothetical protein n=1 Tax=Luteimonas sp. YGD11-2 TaxID=2508168 RepID=UPI00100BA79D|nr:hypothetical protein [Luteimonas sp. YGD11-2]
MSAPCRNAIDGGKSAGLRTWSVSAGAASVARRTPRAADGEKSAIDGAVGRTRSVTQRHAWRKKRHSRRFERDP